jgi:hypothetical protein
MVCGLVYVHSRMHRKRLFYLLLLFLGTRRTEATSEYLLFSLETSNQSTEVVSLNTSALANMYMSDGTTAINLLMLTEDPYMVGTDSSAVNASTRCPQGLSFWDGAQCQACQTCTRYTLQACSVTNDTVCETVCPAGAMLWNTLCTLCSPGYYSDTIGDAACDQCTANTYAGMSGATACSPCATGYSSKAGASACVPVCKNQRTTFFCTFFFDASSYIY